MRGRYTCRCSSSFPPGRRACIRDTRRWGYTHRDLIIILSSLLIVSIAFTPSFSIFFQLKTSLITHGTWVLCKFPFHLYMRITQMKIATSQCFVLKYLPLAEKKSKNQQRLTYRIYLGWKIYFLNVSKILYKLVINYQRPTKLCIDSSSLIHF